MTKKMVVLIVAVVCTFCFAFAISMLVSSVTKEKEGYVGEEKVTVYESGDDIYIAGKNGSYKHCGEVESFAFTNDNRLVIQKQSGELIELSRTTQRERIGNDIVTATMDFSVLKITADSGKIMIFGGVEKYYFEKGVLFVKMNNREITFDEIKNNYV